MTDKFEVGDKARITNANDKWNGTVVTVVMVHDKEPIYRIEIDDYPGEATFLANENQLAPLEDK